MSPELAEGVVGLEGLDARADVWAAGVVLHEALTGQRLFPQAHTQFDVHDCSNACSQACAHVQLCALSLAGCHS